MKTVQFGYISYDGGQCFIDGKIVDLPKHSRKRPFTYKLIQKNDRVFFNTYEYKNGVWKHTIRAYWYYIFG